MIGMLATSFHNYSAYYNEKKLPFTKNNCQECQTGAPVTENACRVAYSTPLIVQRRVARVSITPFSGRMRSTSA